MSGILSLMCTWIYSIITTDKRSEILHKVSNLNKLLPEKQSWLSLILHIPVGDDVSPQHSLHTSFRSPLFLSGSCQSSPASPFQPFTGPCPHHWTTTASCPLTQSLWLSKYLLWLHSFTFPWETRVKFHTQKLKSRSAVENCRDFVTKGRKNKCFSVLQYLPTTKYNDSNIRESLWNNGSLHF